MNEETSGRSGARGGGRPAADDPRDVRAQLLLAARDLFTRFGFDAVSTRRLAAAAETTPGMIHYYFGDKHGLYRALLEEVIPPVLAGLEARETGANSPLTVADFMEAYLAMFRDNPWLPPLVFREMQEGADDFQRHFVERFATRARQLLKSALENDRRQGRVRDGLDSRMALASVMSLCVFPFLARPMLDKVLGLSVDHDFVRQWSTYASTLFYRGVQP